MFFSVRVPMKIGAKTYTPCVCYALTKELEATVNKLSTEGKVYIFTEKVGFMNGKTLSKKKKTSKKASKKKETTAVETEETVVKENLTTESIDEGF